MLDRHLSTDIGLALLIALPFLLPASPSPRSAESEVSSTAAQTVSALAGHSDRVAAADAGS